MLINFIHVARILCAVLRRFLYKCSYTYKKLDELRVIIEASCHDAVVITEDIKEFSSLCLQISILTGWLPLAFEF